MPRVPLQTLLRDGIRADELRARARHFVDSAQVASGQRAPSPWREALAGCLDAFVTAIEGGIEAEGDPATTVILFRRLRYRIDASRTAYTLEVVPTGEAIASFDVGSPMRTFGWVKAMKLADALRPSDRPADDWIDDRLTRFARRHIDGIALRRHLVAILAPCPVALLRARRTAAAHPSRSDCPAAWLQGCTRNADLLDEIQRIAPGVLPLVGRHHDMVAKPLHRAILREVRATVLRNGAIPTDWARAVTSNARPLWACMRKGEVLPWIDAVEYFGSWCRVHRDLPPQVQLPRSMWLTVLRPNGEGVTDALTPPRYWKVAPRFVRSAIAASLEARARGHHEAFLVDWAHVVRWLADFMRRGIGTPPRSFKSALRRARSDERRARAAAMSTQCVFPAFNLSRWVHGDWMAVDLASTTALVDHALRQAHCGETLVESCVMGKLRIFAVEAITTGETIGTVALERWGDGWRPSNAKHFANRPPIPKLVDFAFRLASAIENAEGRAGVFTTANRRAFVIRTLSG